MALPGRSGLLALEARVALRALLGSPTTEAEVGLSYRRPERLEGVRMTYMEEYFPLEVLEILELCDELD